jgi:hypothetical protein
MDYRRRLDRTAATRRAAAGLGWFSIGLGLTELLFARPMARVLGMKGEEGLLRFYGAREVATGLGILGARDPAPWIWGRVAGDGLDVATLLAHFEDSPRKGNIALALAAVAGATALDVVTAEALTQQKKLPRAATHDYSDRSGFPQGIEAARGLAKDFQVPRDMRAALPSPEQRTHIH